MSTVEVKVVEIAQIIPHPNADRLEIAQIDGWQCVVGKGTYKQGDAAVYIPIDSILPAEVETKLFGPDSKIKLSKSRVKTIKIRGAISQGMLADFKVLELPPKKVGTDVTEALGITKFEPPVVRRGVGQMAPAKKKAQNPEFKKYTSFEHAKKHNKMFQMEVLAFDPAGMTDLSAPLSRVVTPADEVVITEKIHGTNFRCGWVPYCASTFWKKVKQFLRLAPQYEFVYGSHNVQLQDKVLYNGYYKDNVYSEAVVKYNLKTLLQPGEVIYGEIYGSGVQKGYDYGCKTGERKFIAFDLMRNGQYVDYDEFLATVQSRCGLPVVPLLYRGDFKGLDHVAQFVTGDSVLAPTQKVREGAVIKTAIEKVCYAGRSAVKFINDAYLLRENDEEGVEFSH